MSKDATKGFDVFEAMQNIDLSRPLNTNLEPVGRGEKVLGVMNDNIERIFRLRQILAEDMKKIASDIDEKCEAHLLEHDNPGHTLLDCVAFHQNELRLLTDELEKKEKQVELLGDMFWSALRLKFPEIDSEDNKDAGIRQEGKVVVVPIKRMKILVVRSFFENLFR